MDKIFITRKLNGKTYIETIDEQINMYAIRIVGNKHIFQRENHENSTTLQTLAI